MADSRFFPRGGPYTVADVADHLGLELTAGTDGSRRLDDVGTLSEADAATLGFLANSRYLSALGETGAGAVLVEEGFLDRVPSGTIALVSRRPYYDFARASHLFYPEPPVEPGIHPRAWADPSAELGDGVRLDAGAVVEAGAQVGAGCWIAANAVIGPNVRIGAGTRVGPGASINYSEIGENCRIHDGARIGTRGFGFAIDRDGVVDIPQTGIVHVGHFVEIGANTTVDRGMGPSTVIGDGSKIDNLVQIAHNVRLGRGCVLAGQMGIAGSAVLEDFVICGAQSGIGGHITVGKGSQVAGRAGVLKDLEPGAKVGGIPAIPMREFFRQAALLRDLDKERAEKLRKKSKSSKE